MSVCVFTCVLRVYLTQHRDVCACLCDVCVYVCMYVYVCVCVIQKLQTY